ncbi:CWF19-like protein 1 homolog [Diorhabda sublineata]|uniref:CWF19-like protein 1 homolog n=1 Tax=Diorhabda sublineata TaxID=1163346 RepID=UPI0024E05BC5|nr:CWF19-like protein 1 homolog [Diorhabda sublineata]
MSEKQKILLCGDVEGKFDTLFKRVESINKKSGPFDCLLCVGNFFGINNRQFISYKLGDKKVPIPTYILGANKEDHVTEYPADDSQFELCPNVYYLGKRGIYTDSKGVKIAYISGIAETNSKKAWTYSEKDISDLCDVVYRNPSFRGVDILLTSQWPSNIISDETKNITLPVNMTSDFPSYLCMKLKPRYIISGLEGIYYERPPFRCPNLGDNDTTMELATRFIGLARVGNPDKLKWIYALSITPLDKIKVSELLQKTTDESFCPFNLSELENKIFKVSRKNKQCAQYFYDMDAPIDIQNTKKHKKPRVEFDQSKCWFCLASPSVEKHLIICVGNSTYLALAKGGMVEEHFLICPIEHHQSSLTLQADVLDELKKFKNSIRKFYNRVGKLAIFFERNYKTSHMQLQAIPITKNANKELKEIFIEESDAQGFKLESLESFNRLDQVIPPKIPYFTIELTDGTLLYTKLQGVHNFPINFAREVLASGPVLNMKDREDWKNCILEKSEEEKLVQRLRTEFQPYDFTND